MEGTPGRLTAPLGENWIQLPGGTLFYRSNSSLPPPDSPAIVLVHGLVVSSAYMVPIGEYLTPHCRVFAPDLPGFGRSYKPWPVLDVPQLADVLVRWMDAIKLKKAHFLGNSFGCQILTEFALRYPERMDLLVLQGPTVDQQARSLGRQWWRLMRDSAHEPPGLALISLRDYAAAGISRAMATVRIVLADRIEERLPLVETPTLVVIGAKDPLVPPDWAEEVTRLLPQAQLRVVPGYGHVLNYAAPLELFRVIAPFLGIASPLPASPQ